jgi:hypothetical protein
MVVESAQSFVLRFGDSGRVLFLDSGLFKTNTSSKTVGSAGRTGRPALRCRYLLVGKTILLKQIIHCHSTVDETPRKDFLRSSGAVGIECRGQSLFLHAGKIGLQIETVIPGIELAASLISLIKDL